jgi:uncharacterized protein (DUF2344 family)
LNYAFEKPTKHYLQDLVIDTEHAIQLNEDEQNIYRHLACNKVKQIQEVPSTNTLHKRQNYIAKWIREKLEQNNLTINKADKGNTIVIIDKNIHKRPKTSSKKINLIHYRKILPINLKTNTTGTTKMQ